MSFSRGLKDKAIKVWEEGYNHPFVQELGKGTLDKEKFKFYLLQDYLYLLQYAKVYAMAAVKAEDEMAMTNFTNVQHYIFTGEMDIHREYMARYGVTKEEIENARASLFNRTYTANMLAYGLTGNLTEIIATIFPCAWTYSDYGKRLKAQYAGTLENNFYGFWIEKYASFAFEESFEWFYDYLDNLVEKMTDKQRRRIEEIFISSVEFEYLFWDMAYKQQMSYE